MRGTRSLASLALARAVTAIRLPESAVLERTQRIHQDLLAHSRFVRVADFASIHPLDLEFLFAAYDERFFSGLCRQSLNGRRLSFRLAPRMTQSGGKTTRFLTRAGKEEFEIAVAITILFDAFRAAGREVTVCGLDCRSRLDALQRIFEHEMVHLIEQLCWLHSDCAAPRFQEIAAGAFAHRAHTHSLITRRERAAAAGIRVGSRVSFAFEGRQLNGRVNRITKRATVLVEDSGGELYSDQRRYKAYYVPLQSLQLIGDPSL